MSEQEQARVPGAIGWVDLTVEDADGVAAFYEAVVGWTRHPVAMDGYDDFAMLRADGEAVSGVCHARGSNAGLPAAWIMYVNVTDLEASLDQVRARGGEVLQGPRSLGSHGDMAVIRDPAGAVLALMGPPR